ncbi:hypothetical protein ACIBK9_47220 [Nonomuraea sp. NPDC050227]|uniref:hypothetical protein n=1 Tax=Nonomuraea sp. NPDC050227 TaxID=3364360 RepID=UPI003797D118
MTAVEHLWSVDQDAYEDVSDDGRYVEWKPTGYASFRCSCGIFEHGRSDMIVALAKLHLGEDEL